MAAIGKQLVEQDLVSAVTDAFGRVLIAAATARSAAAAVEAARADRDLAAATAATPPEPAGIGPAWPRAAGG